MIHLFDSTSLPKVRTQIGFFCLWRQNRDLGPNRSEFGVSKVRTPNSDQFLGCLWTRPEGVLGLYNRPPISSWWPPSKKGLLARNQSSRIQHRSRRFNTRSMRIYNTITTVPVAFDYSLFRRSYRFPRSDVSDVMVIVFVRVLHVVFLEFLLSCSRERIPT